VPLNWRESSINGARKSSLQCHRNRRVLHNSGRDGKWYRGSPLLSSRATTRTSAMTAAREAIRGALWRRAQDRTPVLLSQSAGSNPAPSRVQNPFWVHTGSKSLSAESCGFSDGWLQAIDRSIPGGDARNASERQCRRSVRSLRRVAGIAILLASFRDAALRFGLPSGGAGAPYPRPIPLHLFGMMNHATSPSADHEPDATFPSQAHVKNQRLDALPQFCADLQNAGQWAAPSRHATGRLYAFGTGAQKKLDKAMPIRNYDAWF